VLCKANLDGTKVNARQAFRVIKASKDPPHLALPYRCHVKAPDDINVYTDGSWIIPLQQYLGLGGAGVWWPGRDPAVYLRLSTAEKELAYCSQEHGGLMLYTPIGGYSGSSTRTELAAAILALAANGPVHLGTDSKVFHDKALLILGNLRKGNKIKYNWQLVSDGDLWNHFEQAARAKGYKSIRITKVKGHAKQQQVNEGIYRQCDKDGNDQADRAADLATNMHGEDVVKVANILHGRHVKYTSFFHKVVKHIIEGYLIHRKLVEKESSKQANDNDNINYQPLLVQSSANASKIVSDFRLQGSIFNYKAFGNKHKQAQAVWDFIDELKYFDIDHQYHATSWLELYLIYRIKGFPKPIPDNMSKARARATIFSQLTEFKKTVRGIIDRGINDEEKRNKFRPLKVTHERFLSLGIKGKHAAISCSIDVDDETLRLLELNLITLGHRVSTKQQKDFREGKITFKPVVPNLKGRAGWDSKIKLREGALYQPKPRQKHTANCCKRSVQPVCFQCPQCKASVLSSNQAFQNVDLDKVCKCKSCKAYVKVRDWRCSCLNRWHLCDKHQSYANPISKKPPSSLPSSSSSNKRQLGPFSMEQLREIDTKRMRKCNSQLLTPSPNILSVKLRERFAYLFKEE
jgi:hypothetical protein